MSDNTVAGALWRMLADAGVKRCYGIVGDALNAVLSAKSDVPEIEFIHVRNEEAGVFAANAEAFVTGEPVAVCGTSGPGAVHLINGLYDALHEKVPVIAIGGDTVTAAIGSGTVEEVDPSLAYLSCTLWRARIETPLQAPAAFKTAIDTAITERGPVLLSIPADVASMKYPAPIQAERTVGVSRPVMTPAPDKLEHLAEMINSAQSVMIYGGDGCRDAHDAVVELAAKIKAPVGYSWRGKNCLEADNPYGVGMTGLLGWGAAYAGMHECDLLLLLGTDMPFTDFYPTKVQVAQVDLIPGHIGRRTPRLDFGAVGKIENTIPALLPLVQEKTDTTFLDKIRKKSAKSVERMGHYVRKGPDMTPIRPEYLAATISEKASDDAFLSVDVGTAFIWSARYFEIKGRRQMYASASWASMATAMPNAMGVALAQPGRQVLALCGDGGLSMQLGELITIAERQLPVKLFVLHNSMLDFVNIEFQEDGLAPVGTDLWTPNFADVAKAIGLESIRVEDPKDLPAAVDQALAATKPILVDVVVDKHALAMPPHVEAKTAVNFGFSQMRQILHGHAEDVAENVDKNIGLV